MPEATLPLQFRGFGASVERDGATTYAAICTSAADDADIMDIIAQAPPAQRRPNLLLAAVHYLLLSGVEHPLGAFYDTVRPAGAPAPDGDVGEAFRDFCLTYRQEVLELVTTRSTQTNEVNRCAVLLPGLCGIATQYHPQEALSLLDLGTSAGLNLLFDRYTYTYRQRHDTSERTAGVPASPVMLGCSVAGRLDELPDLTLPAVADRAGLDLSPIDAGSKDEALWLLACLWPDNLSRFNRLRAALDVWRNDPEPPRIMQGDMVDDLASVAATLGGDSPLVVFHSWAVAYLSEPRQKELVETIRSLGRLRPVHHLYAELPFETPGLPTPDSPGAGTGIDGATALVHIGPGTEAAERWANVHPHGNWIRWFGPHMAVRGAATP
jgi:hypothetical protein